MQFFGQVDIDGASEVMTVRLKDLTGATLFTQVVLHEILNAIFYILRGGVPWRMLPGGFPPWKTVFHYFRQWRLSGLWETINTALRERRARRWGARPSPPPRSSTASRSRPPRWAGRACLAAPTTPTTTRPPPERIMPRSSSRWN